MLDDYSSDALSSCGRSPYSSSGKKSNRWEIDWGLQAWDSFGVAEPGSRLGELSHSDKEINLLEQED